MGKTILGVMSGTSLDGLDIAVCTFHKKNSLFEFQVIAKQSIRFSPALYKSLSKCRKSDGLSLSKLDVELGHFIGQSVKDFVSEKKLKVDYIASHGHTVFHQPEIGLTKQIGNGAEIYAITGIPTINDFRTVDVALKGQGAPLVPIGDQLLFPDYDYCLNLGGIANVSYDYKGERQAFDISACNILLNYLSNEKGLEYDKGGKLGKSGKLNKKLFDQLNAFEYFSNQGPKTLGIEWIEENQISLINNSILSLEDKLCSVYHHIAYQIAQSTNSEKVLITGGGAHNTFLIELIERYSDKLFPKAPKDLIDFKEAIIFAFLGYLRITLTNNCLSSVTGATSDNIGGAIYGA